MSLLPPFTFNVNVIAEKDKDLVAKIVGFTDSTPGAVMKTDPNELSGAYTEVAKMKQAHPVVGGSSSQSSRGGKSKKNRKSKGGKSRKARKSLRRK